MTPVEGKEMILIPHTRATTNPRKEKPTKIKSRLMTNEGKAAIIGMKESKR